VSHIFNFDVPWQADDYVHRIGRTGRAGKEGRSLSIVTPDDIRQLKDIEKMLGAPVTWIGEPPSEGDIAEGARKRRGRSRGGAGRDAGAGGRRDSRRGGSESARPAARARSNGHRHDQPPRSHEETARPPRAASAAAAAQGGKSRQRRRAEPKPQRQPWEPRPPQRRDREDRVPTPVGLGDHVPAFLRRPVR
jgi:superfamily II DNA/RNA helicase